MYGEEKIVDIKDILYRTCRHWRSICVTGLVLLVCLLLVKLPIMIRLIKTAQNDVLVDTILKYSGLGIAAGILFSAFFYISLYILSEKVYLAEDISYKCKLNLIGCIPYNSPKKKNSLDNLIKKIFDIRISGEMQEILLERAAEEILVLISSRNLEPEDMPVVALVSSYSAEISAGFEIKISKKLKREVRLVNAGNILQDARSIRMVDRADFVILIEEQGKTRISEYKEICRKLSIWRKEILGVVLMDVV